MTRMTVGLMLLLSVGLAGCGGPDAHDVVNRGCSADADCPAGRCMEDYPGGLCTKTCGNQGECPAGTACVESDGSGGVCLFRCESAEQCRQEVGDGYECDCKSDVTTGEDVDVCIDG